MPRAPFTLEHLTEDVVKDKVARFVHYVVMGKKKTEGSVYETRGPRFFSS